MINKFNNKYIQHKHSPYLKALIIGALFSTITACSTYSRFQIDTDNTLAEKYVHDKDLKVEIDAIAQPLIDQKITPGLVVGVLLPDGSKHIFGYGVTSATESLRPDGDTLFAIGSLSKGFLGATTAILVQEKTLSWDDTLEQLLPRQIPLSNDAKKITLLQLATHTSGLPRQPFSLKTLSYVIQYLFTGKNFYRNFDRNYISEYLANFDAPEIREPQYSNIGYSLLGYALELRTGKTVDALVQEKMLTPLQLTHTSFAPERLSGYGARARGHVGDQPKFMRRGQPAPDWEFTDVLIGSAALYSTANDLLIYADAHLRESNDATRNLALSDTLKIRIERPEQAAAIAWIVDDIQGHKVAYQVGVVGGYSSYLGMDVPNKTVVVVLQNSFNWTNSIGHRLLLRLAYVAGKK